jgi:MoxR-like ATPase
VRFERRQRGAGADRHAAVGADDEARQLLVQRQQVDDLGRRLQPFLHAVDQVVDYAVNIVRATRQHSAISLGAGTRGAISLVRIAKSYALLEGRRYITPADVKRAVLPVLRHRVQLAPEIAISGQTVDDMLTSLLKTVEAPRV